jgi:hypothetical protein
MTQTGYGFGVQNGAQGQQGYGQQGQQGQNGYGQQGGGLPSVDDMLGGSGSRKGRSMTFPTLGTERGGVVCDAPYTQQKLDDDGKPKFWEGTNDPVVQLVIPVKIDPADPANRDLLGNPELTGEEDYVRYFYVSGSRKPESMSSLAAVRGAIAASGTDRGLEIGGRLRMKWVDSAPKVSAMRQPAKKYIAEYMVPANEMLTGPVEQAQPAQQYQAPAPQQGQTGYMGQAAPVAGNMAPPAQPEQQTQPAVPAAPAGDPRAETIRAEFGHLGEAVVNGLIGSGLPLEVLRSMPLPGQGG